MSDKHFWGGTTHITYGLSLLAGDILDKILIESKEWRELRALLVATRSYSELSALRILEIKERILALTEAQQTAVNDLSSAVDTLAGRLETVEAAATDIRTQLVTMTAEEGREEAERTRLQEIIDAMDTTVINALSPITARVTELADSLQTPEEQGGSALTPS